MAGAGAVDVDDFRVVEPQFFGEREPPAGAKVVVVPGTRVVDPGEHDDAAAGTRHDVAALESEVARRDVDEPGLQSVEDGLRVRVEHVHAPADVQFLYQHRVVAERERESVLFRVVERHVGGDGRGEQRREQSNEMAHLFHVASHRPHMPVFVVEEP